MADNYLENHYEEYLKRKAAWEKNKKCSFRRTAPKTNVCICGGGNIGHVLGGFLGSKENYKVTILTRQPDKWCAKDNLPLTVTDCNGKIFNGLIFATDNPELAMKDCDIVFITLPGFAIAEQLRLIAPYVTPKTYIGSVFCSSGFFPMAMKILPQNSKLFGFQRVPFISRLVKYGHSANLLGYRPQFNIATYNIDNKQAIGTLLNKMFDTQIKLLDNYMEATLTNSNPLLHPSRLYGMMKGKEMPFSRNILFYEEWDDVSSQLLIDCDREFQELRERLQIPQSAIPTILDYYESHDAHSLTEKIRSIKSFCGIYAPMKETDGGYIPDYNSRYFTEDIPFGLILIKSYAVKYKVATPNIDTIILWAQENMGKKYLTDGQLNGENIDETVAQYITE